jgi:DNA-binding response OmpR family regulator
MKKILIVEDNISMRYLLERIFKDSYIVRTADDGLTAMVLLRKGYIPDVIITDINMPSINGKELIAYLKKSSLYCNIPIITLSSLSNEELEFDNLFEDIDDIIQKPFEPKELIQRVSSVVKKHNNLSVISSQY